MIKPIEIQVKPHGITYKARAAGHGGDKLSCTCTGGESCAAAAWVRKFYGPKFEAVKTERHFNSGKTLWEVWECRRKSGGHS